MNKDNIINKLKKIHGDDKEQLKFIFSEEQRIVVTAPAGCGKTKSMISKIAFEIATNTRMNLKKILALTFSVNAATKMKEDIAEILPKLIEKKGFDINRKLDVSNYHSFCTRLIRRHGYIIHTILNEIESFTIVPEHVSIVEEYVTGSELKILKSYNDCLSKLKFQEVDNLEQEYYRVLIDCLVPNKVITYNGLLLLAQKLLGKESIQRFYQNYYSLIIIDEFQDTNYLSYKLIKALIGENKIILIGDDIQKIYGFLGAMPDLFTHMVEEYGMKGMELKTNYRFKDNESMKNLDMYLRGVFKNYDKIDNYKQQAEVKFKLYKSARGEAKFIVRHMLKKIEGNHKVALLVRAGYAANHIISELHANSVSYYNGLFNDTDMEYIRFHKSALDLFIEESGASKSVSSKVRTKVLSRIQDMQSSISSNEIIFNSLYRLLEVLFNSLSQSGTSKLDKYNKVIFILSNNSLKRMMNEIDEDIILTTIHGSKGLEWDYIYIPEITAFGFPTSRGICSECNRRRGSTVYEKKCEFKFLNDLRSSFEEELSLFYVGITRGKKDVLLCANTDMNNNGFNKRRSCLVSLPNLTLNTNFE